MHDNYNYPVGADNPDAPWNASVRFPKSFDVQVTQTFSKLVSVCTNGYASNPKDTDWKQILEDEGVYTIPRLIGELRAYIENDLKKCGSDFRKERRLKRLLDSCDKWEIIDSDYEQQ